MEAFHQLGKDLSFEMKAGLANPAYWVFPEFGWHDGLRLVLAFGRYRELATCPISSLIFICFQVVLDPTGERWKFSPQTLVPAGVQHLSHCNKLLQSCIPGTSSALAEREMDSICPKVEFLGGVLDPLPTWRLDIGSFFTACLKLAVKIQGD